MTTPIPGGIGPQPDGTFLADDPKRIIQNTERCLNALFTHNGLRTLKFYRERFFRWTGTYWEVLDTKTLESMVRHLFKNAVFVGTVGRGANAMPAWVDFDFNAQKQREIMKGLQDEVLVDAGVETPVWLDGNRIHATAMGIIPPRDVIALENCLLHTSARQWYAHTPKYFNSFSTGYAYDAAATVPEEWLKFLDSIWPEDQESIDCLQEIFGYMLTQNTGHHKMFMLYGAKRGGKGTIIRILEHLLGGDKNVASTSIAELATDFGLGNLEKKSMAVMSDLRFRSGSSDDGTAAMNLLRITGEDTVTINRKFKDAYDTRLRCRFLIASNELPRIRDESGALSSRIILLKFTKSFLGREDKTLDDRLLACLSGILNWSLHGLERLNRRGEFVQPKSGLEDLEVIVGLTSPTLAFIDECCEVGDNYSVEKKELFAVYRGWCEATGTYSQDQSTFGKNLRAAVPTMKDHRPRIDGKAGPRQWLGLRLNTDAQTVSGTTSWVQNIPRSS